MNLLLKLIFILAMLIIMNVANAGLVDKLDGVWEGKGRQSSTSSQWTIKFTAKNGIYRIEYPSIPCSGSWTFLSETSGSVTFFEKIEINRNRCVDEGTVELFLIESNKLKYTYYRLNGLIDAFGELFCSSCNININYCNSNDCNSNTSNASYKNGILHIPKLDVPDSFGGFVTYEVDLSLIPLSNPMTFKVTKVNKK